MELINQLITATDENINGLKVIGVTINTYITETLLQHRREETSHSGLRETYIQGILTDITARLADLEKAKVDLEKIIQDTQSLKSRLDKLESKNV